MNKQLILFPKNNWTGDYKINEGTTTIGETDQDDYISDDSKIKLGEEELYFEIKGFLSPKGSIYLQKQIIGTIEFNIWGTNAAIELGDNIKYEFGLKSSMSSTYQLISEQKSLLIFSNDWYSTQIDIEILEENISQKLLMTGIFLVKYFKKKMAIIIMVAVFIPFLFY